DVTERILNTIMNISNDEMNQVKNIQSFMNKYIAHIEVDKESDIEKIATSVLVGPMAIVIDGYDECMLLDVRTYPARGTEEPPNEQTLKGPRDGFVETIVMNTALIRRRIRDEKLVFEMTNIGNKTKTDVSIGYIKGCADEKVIDF
ncbi:spore germination protein, partial [Clostridium tertium]